MPFEDLIYFDEDAFPPFPPFVKDIKERLTEIRNFETRADDILLYGYPKTGRHWLWEIITMLLKGKAEYEITTSETTFLESLPDLSMIRDMTSPRVLNTHVPIAWLPQSHCKNRRKIIHTVRNPKDVYVSLYKHWQSSDELGCASVSWSEFFETVVIGKEINLFGGWFNFEKNFYDVKLKDGISAHTIYYENLKKDAVTEIQRLSNYLDLKTDESLCQEIAEKCSFKNMKQADKTIKDYGDFKNFMESMGKTIPNFFRKGQVGDWKNWFTDTQNELFDNIIKKETQNINIQLTYEL